MQPDNNNVSPGGEVDREGAMAKADLHKLANYSIKLFKKIQDEDQLEGWVQAKITKAADYIASVYHYLEYEMKISEYGSHLENAEVYTESQKEAIKNKLMEAKEKVKALKVAQAEKQKKAEKPKKVEEGILSGGEKTCEACGGSGMVHEEPKQVPDHVKAKVEKYNRQAKAMHAASKRIDRNKNGIPDDEEMEEGQEDLKKVGDSYKTSRGGTVTKTATGVKHEKGDYSDEDHAEPAQKKPSKAAKSAAEKKADKEKEVKLPKHSGNTWGMKNGEKFGQKMEGTELKGKQKNLDVDDDGDIEADDLADLRAGKKDKKVDEAKGKKPDFLDMDKDGDKKEPMKKAVADKKKNPFDKKNESVEVEAEVIAESTEVTRLKELTQRLLG